jgi:hypothetical protein
MKVIQPKFRKAMQFWILIIALSGESAPKNCLSELSGHILVSIKRTLKKLSDETP